MTKTKTEEKLLAFLTANSAYQSQAIPNKNKFTFISKTTGVPQAWTLDENNEPILFAEFEDRVMGVYHSPKGNKSIIGVDYNGNEKQQFYLLSDDNTDMQELVHEPEYFHHFGGWSSDGTHIVYSSNRRHPGFFDIFTLNVETRETKKVFEYDGQCQPMRWLPDGEHILYTLRETNIDSAVYILNIHNGKQERIGKKDELARYHTIDLADNVGYVLTDLGGETIYLGRFQLDKPEQIEKLIHFEKWDMETFKLSPNKEKAYFTVNEGGISKLFTLNIETMEQKEATGVPVGSISSLSWMNDDEFIFTLKTATSPGDVWQYSITDDTLTRKTFAGKSEVEDDWIEPKLYTFRSFDGLEVPYFYYEKEGMDDKNKPAVIWIHGGPESQIRTEYNPVIQYLASEGFTVVTPNVRGSNGYGRTYIKLDDVRKRMDSVKDISYLVQDLIDTHDVDPKRVGVIGRSYGGFMVLACMTHYPDLWAAGVDIVGISHFKSFLENTGAWRRRIREFEYGSIENDLDFFEEIAPLNHSDKIKAPLLIFHGRNDTRVPVTEAEQLERVMKERGQTVELTVFDNEGHQTEKIDNQITQNTSTVEFFKKHLLGDK